MSDLSPPSALRAHLLALGVVLSLVLSLVAVAVPTRAASGGADSDGADSDTATSDSATSEDSESREADTEDSESDDSASSDSETGGSESTDESSDPEGAEAEDADSETDESETDESESTDAEGTDSESADAGSTDSETDQPETEESASADETDELESEAESSDSESADAERTDSETDEPESEATETADAETRDSESGETESADAEHADSEAAVSDGANIDVPDLEAPPDAPAPFRVAVGPLVAGRSMRLEGDIDRTEHRPSMYVGGQVAVSGTLFTFDELGARLRLDADLGYGVTRSADEPVPEDRPLVTELMFGGVRLFAMRQLVNRLHAGLGVGFQATSVILEPNYVYTGHRYLAGEMALRLQWRAVPGLLTAAGGAAAYPVFATANSDGAHGPGRSFGGRVSAEVTLRLAPGATSPALRAFRLVATYRYQRYRSQFPRSPIGTRGGDSVDNQHVAALLVEYAIPPEH